MATIDEHLAMANWNLDPSDPSYIVYQEPDNSSITVKIVRGIGKLIGYIIIGCLAIVLIPIAAAVVIAIGMVIAGIVVLMWQATIVILFYMLLYINGAL